MRAFDADGKRVRVYTNCILTSLGFVEDSWAPDKGDTETATLLWQVAVGECPAGILADRLEERYDLVELANLIRKGSGVGV